MLEQTTRSKELQILDFHGSDVTIPDLYALLPGWKIALNENYDIVKKQTHEWMASWIPSEAARSRLQKADFPLLAGCLFPDAGEEEYRMMAYYHAWVFIWDDEVDCGPLANDIEKAQLFQKETEAALIYFMGSAPFDGPAPPMRPVVSALSSVAEKVAPASTPEMRFRVLRELNDYVESACSLPFQRRSEQKKLLGVEQFMEQRRQSGGCGPSIYLIQYVHHLTKIPASVLEHEAMKVIWDQVCLIVHLVNDIVSFPKEFRDNQLDNIVPVLVLEHDIPVQEAIYRACDLVRNACLELDNAETRLPLPSGDSEVDRQIRRYVQGCKELAAGNLKWCCSSERYFGKNPQRVGNAVTLRI